MKTVAIIQARVGSTRLPGKVLMDICGKPAIERLVDRVVHSEAVDKIVIATGDRPENEPLKRWCYRYGVDVFVGSEDDVLGRVLGCAEFYRAGRVVDITGDCPLVDYRHINHLCNMMDEFTHVDYSSNIMPRTWPDGFDAQVYKTIMLKMADEELEANSPLREHVGINVHKLNPVRSYNQLSPGIKYYHPDWGLTLDTAEDLTLIRKIFAHFIYNKNYNFSALDIIDYISKNPHLLNINSHIKRKGVAK